MKKIRAVLFDMDGVLVDTEWFYNRRRVAFMEEKGFHFDEIPDLSGSNEPAIWEALVPDDVELRERLRVEYKQVYSPDHPVPYAELLNEQTEPVMRELHERGVKCAIASSSYRELIDELVEIAGIADVLDYTISGHECSAFKPDPEIYLRAMEAVQISGIRSEYPDSLLLLLQKTLYHNFLYHKIKSSQHVPPFFCLFHTERLFSRQFSVFLIISFLLFPVYIFLEIDRFPHQ